MVMRMSEFFSNIKTELKKIAWPTDKEMKLYTSQVFVFMFCMILFFGIVDGVIAQGIAWANPGNVVEEVETDVDYDYDYEDEEETT